MAALTAPEAAQQVEVLVTRVRYAPGKPNGIALALMARRKRPGIRMLFAVLPEFEVNAAGLGEFLAMPVSVAEVVETVLRLLGPGGEGTAH